MPFFALANLNWGGRMHPAFRDLSVAMRLLQGLGRPLLRLIALQYSENEEDQEKGLVGNTILLAQPKPQEVLAKLPPAADGINEYFSVVFNTSTGSAMSRDDVSKQKAFVVDREKYFKATGPESARSSSRQRSPSRWIRAVHRSP